MPEGWRVVEVVGTDEDAELAAGYLRSLGIPCTLESVHSHEFPVNISLLGEVWLQVPSERFEEARRALADRTGLELQEGDETPERARGVSEGVEE
jgi:hypothetical protein